jgi:hypothetical protein
VSPNARDRDHDEESRGGVDGICHMLCDMSDPLSAECCWAGPSMNDAAMMRLMS